MGPDQRLIAVTQVRQKATGARLSIGVGPA